MRVFVAGATGVFGRALLPRLVARGDTVVALARSPERAAPIAGPGVEVIEGDLLKTAPGRLAEALEGCDAAAHLATALRPGATGPDGSNTNTALRIDGTRRLLDAVLDAGVPRYLQQSIVMAYPDGGDRWLDESTPFDLSEARAAMGHPVAVMEAMVHALDPSRVAWTVLRGGAFVGPGTFQDDTLRLLREGTLRVPGDGSNWISPVHVEDITQASADALSRAPAGSTYNITDEPIRNGEYLDGLAARLGLPTPPRDPERSQPPSYRCSSAAARRDLGWAPTHGIWPAALD
ncbi:MAG: NAD(P)H-binding protein [Dehalococcoidia bacterium]|nr:NAD(P)H-binding protein [Dehalococcoidia bacterium]